jgi:hypothetical protein
MELSAPADAGDEVKTMLEMLGLKSESIDADAGMVSVVFQKEIGASAKEKAEALLKRIIRATPKTPSFDITITETDPEVVALLKLSEKTNRSTRLDLDIARGSNELLRSMVGGLPGMGGPDSMMADRQCVWAVPLNSPLPTLTYKRTLKPQAEADPNESEALRSLRNTMRQFMDNTPLTAEHKITTNEAAFEKWAESMKLELENHVYFDFGDQAGVVNPLGGPGTAFSSDFVKCAQSILDNSDDAFLAAFVFPKLVKSLKQYQFEESRF